MRRIQTTKHEEDTEQKKSKKNESLQKYDKKRHLCTVMQKYSQGRAVKGIKKQSCKNILKIWHENVHVPPFKGAGSPIKDITMGLCRNIHFEINIQ